MGWVNKDSGIKKFHSTNKKKQLGGSLRPPVAPLGGGLNPNMPAPPNVGVPNPYLEEGGELKKYQEGNEIPLPLKAMHEEQISTDRKKEFLKQQLNKLLSNVYKKPTTKKLAKLASKENSLKGTFLEKMLDKETDEE